MKAQILGAGSLSRDTLSFSGANGAEQEDASPVSVVCLLVETLLHNSLGARDGRHSCQTAESLLLFM